MEKIILIFMSHVAAWQHQKIYLLYKSKECDLKVAAVIETNNAGLSMM